MGQNVYKHIPCIYNIERAGRQAHTHIHNPYIRLCTVASAMFGFVVDDITRTRYLRKPSASASPFAYDPKYQNSASH